MGEIIRLRIESLASEGYGIAYLNGKVTFVPFTLPDEEAEAELIFCKKNYNQAKLIKIISPSPYRVPPICQHFGTCGGCKWQHLNYETQLQWKQQFVHDAFERIARVTPRDTFQIVPSPQSFFYRNKMEFSFAQDINQPQTKILGFHLPGRFDKVFHVEKCFLQEDYHNNIRNETHKIISSLNLSCYNRKTHEGFLRNLIIRKNSSNEWMVILVVSEEKKDTLSRIFEKLIPAFPHVVSWYYIINQKKNDSLYDLEPVLYHGKSYLEENILQIHFKIRPLSFFQVNKPQAENIYRTVIKWGEFTNNDIVYDLYTGTGTIALCIAPLVKKVIGIDNAPQAIEDAQENAHNNNVSNATFILSDVAKGFKDSLIREHGHPDVVVLDPPRSGLHPNVIQQLLQYQPRRIVYVSCNPATQARDIAMLSVHYDLLKIQPFDMFPQTTHVENVALLGKKQ